MQPKMHPDQVATDPDLLRRLLMRQFPQWEGLKISQIQSWGTDHDIYRIGPDLVARLPRIHWARHQAEKEMKWLPKLGPLLPLSVPRVVAMGEPDLDYPFPWLVNEWLPGRNASETPPKPEHAAVDLAGFVKALRNIETTDSPVREHGERGCDLHEGDEDVRGAIKELGSRVDAGAVTRVWEASLDASMWQQNEVWVHGDLLPGNILVVDRRLSAVIDFGGLNVGDPACDLQAAWNLFDGPARAVFRAALDPDDDSWMRGRGWVVYQTTLALPYYWDTNPGIVSQARHALSQVLAGFDG